MRADQELGRPREAYPFPEVTGAHPWWDLESRAPAQGACVSRRAPMGSRVNPGQPVLANRNTRKH